MLKIKTLIYGDEIKRKLIMKIFKHCETNHLSYSKNSGKCL